MVVTVERQKILRKHSSSNRLKISIPLYLVPYILSFLLFTIILNFLDLFWNPDEPYFKISELTLPEENAQLNETKELILKAEAPDIFPVIPKENKKIDNDRINISNYRTREYDRYSIIASKFGISLDTVISLNDLKESDSIKEGTILKIADRSGIFHIVEKGETLLSLSELYKCEVKDIIKVNGLLTTVIKTGEKLFIPGGSLPESEIKKIIGKRFIIPAEGTVKNNYGSYIDPVTGLKNYNYGIDIINKKGTAVYAAKEGIINNTSFNSYYGRVVQVNHSGDLQSIYSCLDSIVVKPGESVERGDLIGYMGNSGFRNREHLQFSIFEKKEDVDTLEYIF